MLVKTPGVYIEEIKLLPPSVAQVETAIPAFAGYTQFAVSSEGDPLTFIPTRIKSLKDYEEQFGKGYTTESFTITLNTDKNIERVTPDKVFHLYEALKMYFDNGGGPCYIVSAGGYKDTIESGDDSKGLIRCIKEIEKYDEPTLLLFPDAVLLTDADTKPDLDNFAEVQKAALAQCKIKQDRFAILDLMQGDKAEEGSNKPISNFRDRIGINALDYGAAYYPWLINSYTYDVSYRQLKFAAGVLKTIPSTDVEKNLLNRIENPDDGTGAIKNTNDALSSLAATADKKQKLITDATAFINSEITGHKKQITDAMAAPAPDDDSIKAANTAYLLYLNKVVVSLSKTELSSTDNQVQTLVSKQKENVAQVKALTDYIALIKHDIVITNKRTNAQIDETIIKDFFAKMFAIAPAPGVWSATNTVDDIAANTDPAFTNDQDGFMKLVAGIEANVLPLVEPAVAALLKVTLPVLSYSEKLAEDALFTGHSFFKNVKEAVLNNLRIIPPSGAIAGVYARVDGSRGVWKAPANVSLNGVTGPAVKVDNKDQENLNVSDTGKSINVIRTFTGKGTLVWGARTLAGNDNEWRYIPVRRFFIMVEESVKKATVPFVFEPNDANTWIRAKVMIENFLTLQWRNGALQGAKPEEAFFVSIGVGETMTGLDVLEGRMIVEIGMAVVRPAEFIILKFSHKMMEQ